MHCLFLLDMQPFLGLFFSVLLTTGASLECETCGRIGNNCTGHLKTCGADQDICAVVLSKTSLGLKTKRIVKYCEYSHFCRSGLASIHMGPEKTIVSRAACCVGDACRNLNLTLPELNSEFNGKTCPACYSVSNWCPEAVVNCTDSEDTCFDIVIRSDSDTMNTTMKGCTTKSFCAGLNRGKIFLGGFAVTVQTNKCGPITSTSPPSTGHPFLALFGFLLWKTLC